MHARVTTVQVQPGKTDELTQFLGEAVLPLAQQQHGFDGMLILVDPTTQKGLAITMWETEADMEDSPTLHFGSTGAARHLRLPME